MKVSWLLGKGLVVIMPVFYKTDEHLHYTPLDWLCN